MRSLTTRLVANFSLAMMFARELQLPPQSPIFSYFSSGQTIFLQKV